MTRCEEFYEKWKQHPNFCDKSRQSIQAIDFYLKVVDELKERGIDESATYVALSENAARPLHTVKDPAVRNVVLTNVSGMIQRRGKPTAADITTWIRIAEGKEPEQKPSAGPPGPKPVPATTPAAPVKKSYCMYYPRDGDISNGCSAPHLILIKCDQAKREAKNCDIPFQEPEPEPEEQEPQGMTVRDAPRRAIVPGPDSEDAEILQVKARRYAQVAIRQYVENGLAIDEIQAAQLMFDKGVDAALDEVEEAIQRKATEEEAQEIDGEVSI